MLFKTILPFVLATVVYASSRGASICKIDEDAISNGMSATVSNLGYSISLDGNMSANSDTSIKVKLSGKQDYKGILLYVVDEDGKKVGKFSAPSGFKDCSNNCKGEAPIGSMLTHNSKALKKPNMEFEWTPPKLEKCKKLTVQAAIVQAMDSFQVIKDIPIECNDNVKETPSETPKETQTQSESSNPTPTKTENPENPEGPTNSVTKTVTPIDESSSITTETTSTTYKKRCKSKKKY